MTIQLKHKACRGCGEILPLSEYYRHSAMADGHLNKCKECIKARVRSNRAEKIERYREYDRQRAFREDRIAARATYREKAKMDADWRKRQQERRRIWEDRNAVKRRAQIMAGNAIKYGILVKQPCERCGATSVHAHHENYYKPLEVTWLCLSCHGVRHREINEEIRNGADLSLRGF